MRGQEGHQLHVHTKQVQFHLFQYSLRNWQSRFWPIHSLIFAQCHDTTGIMINTNKEYGFPVHNFTLTCSISASKCTNQPIRVAYDMKQKFSF